MSEDRNSVVAIDKFASMQELIESGITAPELAALTGGGEKIALNDIEKRSPIPHPRQDIICLGFNYMDHIKESADKTGKEFTGKQSYAVYFSKRCSEALPDGGVIPPHWDIVDDKLDYEVELAVIIGKNAAKVSAANAYDYVFGYSVFNDVSARGLQRRHEQFLFGKSLDGFSAFGPFIVTKDEIADPGNLDLRCYINGELRQNSNTKHLIFNIPFVISELSQGIELKAGTIIATGTPAGVGFGFDPPRYLKKGDVVRCEIDGVGVLTNTVG